MATPRPPSSLRLVSGETGQVVANASVVVAGQSLRSDAQGTVALPAATAVGALMDVVATGYLDRQSLLREGVSDLPLWPRTSSSGMDENFTATLVYTATTDGASVGGLAMIRHRPSTTVVTIVLSPSLAADEEVVRWHQLAADSLNVATGGKIVHRVTTERPLSGVVVDVSYDPTNSTCESNTRAFTSRRFTVNEISGATVVYCVSDAPRSGTVVHELGHTFGLGHSPDSRDVMYFSFARGRNELYSGKEALAMKLMLSRPPANRFPDNDRDTSGIAIGERTDKVICR